MYAPEGSTPLVDLRKRWAAACRAAEPLAQCFITFDARASETWRWAGWARGSPCRSRGTRRLLLPEGIRSSTRRIGATHGRR